MFPGEELKDLGPRVRLELESTGIQQPFSYVSIRVCDDRVPILINLFEVAGVESICLAHVYFIELQAVCFSKNYWMPAV